MDLTSANALPLYQDVASTLQHINADPTAAEAHGMVCGFICAGLQSNGVNWMEHVIGHSESSSTAAQQARACLLKLYEVSSEQLVADDFSFTMLLPDDEQALAERAASLGDWCYGFLSGIGLGGVDPEADTSTDLDEILQHFMEIANIDYQNVEISNEDETAYTEIVEYTRLAVVAAYQEMTAGDHGDCGDDHCQKHLH